MSKNYYGWPRSLVDNIFFIFIWQTDLLVAAAQTGRIINIKKGQFCAPSVSALFYLLYFHKIQNLLICFD